MGLSRRGEDRRGDARWGGVGCRRAAASYATARRPRQVIEPASAHLRDAAKDPKMAQRTVIMVCCT